MSILQSAREKWTSFLRREKEKLKNMTTRQKIEYFVTYYKVEAFSVLLVIGIIVFTVHSISSLSNKSIVYLGLVDATMSEEQYDRFTSEFKAYVGDTDKKHFVTLDYPIYSSGAIVPEDIYNSDTSYQQKSMLLLGSGVVDAYLCPEVYVQYLLVNEDLAPVREILGDELTEQYADLLDLDGYALRVDPAKLESSFILRYEPVYLVFTNNNHFPEVTRALAPFLLDE